MGQSNSNSTQVSVWAALGGKRASKNNCHFKMSVDAAEVKRICDIYDWDGKGELDMYYFGDIMYAMGLNIMKSVCVKHGQTNDTGKKFCKFDDVVKLVGDAVKEPNNSGNYQDYIEFLNLLGDEMPKEDVQKLLIELAPKEDEEGFIPYMPFWKSSVEKHKSIPLKKHLFLPRYYKIPPIL